MTPQPPAEQARMDQALAGGREARDLLARDGVRVTSVGPREGGPDWYHETLAALQQANRDKTVTTCPHLIGAQPTVVLAEAPTRMICWTCYERARAARTCHPCGRAAGTRSPHGGIEARVAGVAVVYSRILCPPCAGPAAPGGTFANKQ